MAIAARREAGGEEVVEKGTDDIFFLHEDGDDGGLW